LINRYSLLITIERRSTLVFNVFVCAGSMDMSGSNSLANKFNRVQPTQLNILEDLSYLKELVGQSDLVISLLPSQFHHLVAEQCIDLKKNMVTASYCSDKMSELHDRYHWITQGWTIYLKFKISIHVLKSRRSRYNHCQRSWLGPGYRPSIGHGMHRSDPRGGW